MPAPEVRDLVAQCQAYLVGGLAQRLVVAHEAPREDRDRTGEHALDGLVRERLGVRGPVDGDRLRPRDVAPQDRRTRAARAVRLHPAVARDREPVEVLREVLDHVVALGLAVHQHVRPIRSCSSTTRRISAFISSTYCSSVSSPLPCAARALRISGVCGNEPIVVVGSGGRFRRAAWAILRSSKSPRWNASSVNEPVRSRTRAARRPAHRGARRRRRRPRAAARGSPRGPPTGPRRA